jgi:hypothetical protein
MCAIDALGIPFMTGTDAAMNGHGIPLPPLS